MSIKTKKIIRLLCKIVLAIIGLGLIAYLGYFVYRAIVFKPQHVVVTNVTDASATITWTTSSEMKGVVYYSKDNKIIAGPLGFIGTQKAYDDRDVSSAQVNCVDEFNKNASKTKDSTFSVSGDGYDCTNVKVTKIGSYYTHSITITNLDENSTYYFVVGDSLWSFKDSINTVKTFSTAENVGEPEPLFGKVLGDDNTYSNDGLVYLKFTSTKDKEDSIMYSSVTSADGGWYLDAEGVRDSSGKALDLELTNDSFTTKAVYKNYGTSDEQRWILGYFNAVYPNIIVKKTVQVNALVDLFTIKAFAGDIVCKNCSSSDLATLKAATSSTATEAQKAAAEAVAAKIGYGTVIKALTTANGGNASAALASLNLGTVGSSTANYNANAAYGTSLNGTATNITATNNPDGTVTVTANTTNKKKEAVTVSQQCTQGGTSCSGQTVTSVSTCGNKTCETNENKTNCPADCSTSDSSCSSYPADCVKDGKYGACGSNYVCNTSCSVGGVSGYYDKDRKCITETTTACSVGSCSSKGEYCSDSKTLSIVPGKCGVPSDLNCTTNTGLCEKLSNTTSRKCFSDIYVYYNTSGCFTTPNTNDTSSTTAVQTSCSVTYHGYSGANEGNGACEIKCGSQSIIAKQYSSCEKFAPLCKDSSGNEVNVSSAESSSCTSNFVASSVDLSRISSGDLETLVNGSDSLRNYISEKIDKGEEKEYKSDEIPANYKKYCKALGGKYNEKKNVDSQDYDIYTVSCTGISSGTSQLNLLTIPKVYAADSNSEASYTLYLPELGLYKFQMDGVTLSEQVVSSSSHLLYVEGNGVAGYQPPADPENPQANEDYILSQSAYKVTFSQESTAQQYAIKKGINIISFNFMPTSTTSGAYTAKDVISQAKDNGVEIQYITTFNGGRWSSGYSCSSDTCTGTNFTIVPGVGYLVYATEDGTVTIPGYNLSTSIPVAFSAGWNLVGVNGYSTAYTARTFIDSINTISGLTADNVSWWPTSKAKYEGISVDNGTQYGTDFSISPTNGYFVRISKFAPSDTTCKSLIWQAGGTLNGTCGNTK